MRGMGQWVIFAIATLTWSAIAQVAQPPNTDPSKADLRNLNQNGSLVSIRIEPKNPLTLYVVGKEEAKIDVSRLRVFIRRVSPGHQEVLNSHQDGNKFILDEPLDLETPGELEVTAKTPKKTETFHFKISNIPH